MRYFLQEIYLEGYNLAVRTFTAYESYFRTAGSDTVRGKIWSEVIDGSPNQVKDARAGVNIIFQASLADFTLSFVINIPWHSLEIKAALLWPCNRGQCSVEYRDEGQDV